MIKVEDERKIILPTQKVICDKERNCAQSQEQRFKFNLHEYCADNNFPKNQIPMFSHNEKVA